MPKITKRTVDAIARDPDGDVFVWDSGDGAIKGFGVRMKPSGVASYLVQYRNQEGRTRRLVLGRVGTLTPDEARDIASDKLKAVSKGGDPSAERKAARKAMTVGELCDWYLIEARAGRIIGRKGRPIKGSTLDMDESRIERHVKPLIGRRSVAGLTKEDVKKLQADIAAGKTAKARPKKGRTGKTTGGRGVAARTIRMLAAIMGHAGIQNNPARGVRLYSDGKRKLPVNDVNDLLKALGKALREAEAEGKNPIGLAATKALLLTGCRKNEIQALRKAELAAKARCIRFGDTKSDSQVRPIGLAAADFLSSQLGDSDWVFPATWGEGHFTAVDDVLEDLCERMGINGVTPHILRHTFSTVAGTLGYSNLTIKGLLGHASADVTEGYVHIPDAALVAVADHVSGKIAAALDGREGAKVVPLRRKPAR